MFGHGGCSRRGASGFIPSVPGQLRISDIRGIGYPRASDIGYPRYRMHTHGFRRAGPRHSGWGVVCLLERGAQAASLARPRWARCGRTASTMDREEDRIVTFLFGLVLPSGECHARKHERLRPLRKRAPCVKFGFVAVGLGSITDGR
ncbi:Hypothetical protein A7982_03982 [Minicystis rosea]|nr:Hypothetical protein A7982_03982 [Minicystis rosea]